MKYWCDQLYDCSPVTSTVCTNRHVSNTCLSAATTVTLVQVLNRSVAPIVLTCQLNGLTVQLYFEDFCWLPRRTMTRKRFSVWWVVMVVVIEAMGVYSSENSLPSASVKPTTTSSDRSSDIQRLANMVIPRCLSNSSVSDALVPPIVTLTNDTNEAFNIKFEEVDLNCGISQNGIRIDISTDPTDTTTAFIKVINNTPTLFKFHEDPCFKLTTDEFCFYVKPNTNKNESEIVYRYFAYFCLNKSSKNYICDHTTIRRKCCKNNDFFFFKRNV